MGIDKAKSRLMILNHCKTYSKGSESSDKKDETKSDDVAVCRISDANCMLIKLGSLAKSDVELMAGDMTTCSCGLVLVRAGVRILFISMTDALFIACSFCDYR